MSGFWPQFQEILVSILLVAGALVMFVSALGNLRFPATLTRMHAASMAGPLGGGCILLAVALFAPEGVVVAKVLGTILFIFLTFPVAGHAVARAAYISGVEMDPRSVRDDLKGKYDPNTHALKGSTGDGSDPEFSAPDISSSDSFLGSGLSSLSPEPALENLQKEVDGLKQELRQLKKDMGAQENQKTQESGDFGESSQPEGEGSKED